MDYKQRNGHPLIWTHDIVDSARYPEPYDEACLRAGLREIDAPDGSTIFLMMLGDFDEPNSLIIRYAIEAPPSCPARMAFENGEMSWPDFWEHRGWLLRFTFNLWGGDVKTEFIEPRQMDPGTHEALRQLGNQSPYELRRQQLEVDWEFACKGLSGDPKSTERKYRDYMLRHGNRFLRDVA